MAKTLGGSFANGDTPTAAAVLAAQPAWLAGDGGGKRKSV